MQDVTISNTTLNTECHRINDNKLPYLFVGLLVNTSRRFPGHAGDVQTMPQF